MLAPAGLLTKTYNGLVPNHRPLTSKREYPFGEYVARDVCEGDLNSPHRAAALRTGTNQERGAVNSFRESIRSAKRGFAVVGVLTVLLSGLCASGGALADRGNERRSGSAGFERFVFPGGDRGNSRREAIREDQRRERRMSDEQRQQLRRDIDEAGRDIYRRPRRFRGE